MNTWLEDAGLEVVETRELKPVGTEGEKGSSEELLTVTLWLARDRRILIADEDYMSENYNITGTV